MSKLSALVFLISSLCSLSGICATSQISQFTMHKKNPIEKSDSISPDFETLKAFYESSKAPAHLEDFDTAESISDMKCSAATIDEPAWNSLIPKTYSYVGIPGNTEHGPLIPAVPDKLKTVMFFGPPEAWEHFPELDEIAKLGELYSTETDLVLSFQPTPNCTGCEGLPGEILFRKQNDFLSIKQTINLGTEKVAVTYGYCFRAPKQCSYHSKAPSPYRRFAIAYTDQNAKDIVALSDGAQFEVLKEGIKINIKMNTGEILEVVGYKALVKSNAESHPGVKPGHMAKVGAIVWIKYDENEIECAQ